MGRDDDRVQLILDAFTAVAGETEVDGALERAVDVARLATRAPFGAAVLGGAHGVTNLVHAGMTSRQVSRLPRVPQGVGVLGAVLAGEVLRLDSLQEHPTSTGFPAHHLPMHAFLGVPVGLDDEVLGAFYLAKPAGHPPFTQADQALVTALARQCGQVVARLGADRRVQELAAELEAAQTVRAFALERLTSAVDPVEAIDRILELACDQMRMPIAVLARIDERDHVLERVAGPAGRLGPHRGDAIGLDESLCRPMLAGEIDQLVPDTRSHLVARDLKPVRELGIGAYAGVPLEVDGSPFGTLCTVAMDPTALTPADRSTLVVLSELVAHQLERLQDAERLRTRAEQALLPYLAPGGLSVVTQPIVDLADGRVVGVEALARFQGWDGGGPETVFAAAAEAGIGVELELAAVDAALALLPRLPAEVYLSVNVGPATVEDARLAARLSQVPAGRVVLELTEHADIGARPELPRRLDGLRALGVRVAIDDAGAGFAGLRSILDIAPDVIKLDIGLVHGVDHDPARRSLVQALVAFAAELGAALVAEGVETRGELETLRRLGAGLAQGYGLGRPAPLDDALLVARDLAEHVPPALLPPARRAGAPLAGVLAVP